MSDFAGFQSSSRTSRRPEHTVPSRLYLERIADLSRYYARAVTPGQRVRRTVTDDPCAQDGAMLRMPTYMDRAPECIHDASARAFSHREIVIPAAVRRPRQTYIN